MRNRPGTKYEERTLNGRTAMISVKDRDHVTYDDLAAEIAGAVSLGWQELGMAGSGGIVRFEVFVDMRDPNKTWRRYSDGRIERTFSTEPGSTSQPLGVVRRRPTPNDSRRDKVEPLPNPLDELTPETRAAIEAAYARRPQPWKEAR